MKFECFTFHGGEPHIKLQVPQETLEAVCITTRLRSFNDLGLLTVAVDALRRMRVKHLELFLPYFPGARQDRLMTPGEPLTVKIYANLINALQLDKVYILDPHSDVAPALLHNVHVISNHHFAKEALASIKNFHLVSPDAGALKRTYSLAHSLGIDEVIECGKKRETATGNISEFRVYANDLKGKHCIVVDDICDGGGTFLGLAKELKKHYAGRLWLLVTHGIFSRGLEELSMHYERIFCTDSFSSISSDQLTQITCKPQWMH